MMRSLRCPWPTQAHRATEPPSSECLGDVAPNRAGPDRHTQAWEIARRRQVGSRASTGRQAIGRHEVPMRELVVALAVREADGSPS